MKKTITNMIRWGAALVVTFVPVVVNAVESATINVVLKDNRVVSNVVNTTKIADNITQIKIRAKDIPADCKYVEVFADKVRVKKSDLKAFTFNADNCPDLVPIASILAGAANGQSVIKNISRLKIKESDRVESTVKMLLAFGVSAYEKDDNLYINGVNGQFSGGKVSSFNDHRIAMATAIGGIIAKNTVIIDGAEAVDKSYPDFYKDYEKIGGKVND